MDHAGGAHGNFEVAITGHDGPLVQATVTLRGTIPAGGVTLAVVYDPRSGKPVSVSPWRNLGVFVLAELARQTGGKSAAH